MEASLFTKRFDTTSTVDVTEDFTLPDYQPEMRRVIGVRATSSVDGKYLSGDELEADGGVTYTVLYVGGNGAVAQTSQTTSYTGKIPARAEDDRFSPGDMVLGCSVDGVSCRVTGPRKFTLSSRVKLSLLSQKPTDVSLKVEKADGMQTVPAVRKKTEPHKTAALTEVRKSAEIGGEIREREGMQVVMARGEVALSDVRINQQSKKEATVKGDAYVNVLLMSPEGEYVTTRGRAAVEEVIVLPDMPSNAELYAAAFGNVVLIEIEAAEDGMLSWQMEYDIDCDVMKCIEAEVASDAYLTGMEDKLTVENISSYVPAGAVNGRLTTSATAKLRPDMTYVCAWGSGTADKCDVSGGRMIVGGSVKLTVVTAGGGEIIADEVNIPLKYECEALPGVSDAPDGNMAKRMQVNVTDISVRPDGDTLNVTAELAISCIALLTEQVSAAVVISPEADGGTDHEQRGNVIRVYIPDEGETAWDVEKRFRLGREASPQGNAYII